ncbi:MAG: hypothetical protein JXA30_04670 [Deltaproteobacteria bacterium]|nr:hypothetical protein [Deltaproteobacteria bacterium]
MRYLQTVAIAVALSIAATGLISATAQQQPNATRPTGLKRLFQARAREAAHPNTERLEFALKDISSRPLAADNAAAEIDLARRALNLAIALRRAKAEADAERAEQIVEAALLLAGRKIARKEEETALRVVERKAIEAERAAERAKDDLERWLQKRAAILLESK